LIAVVGAAVAAAVVIAVWSNSTTGAASAGESKAIQKVILNARRADIGLAVVPAVYQGSRLPQRVAARMKRRVDRQCRMYYVRHFLRDCVALHKLQIDEDVAGRFLVLEGNVTSIRFSNIEVKGRKATASAVITESVGTAQRTHGKLLTLRTHNTVQLTYRLIRSGGGWRISSVGGGYLPGSGP
jgi:hypothetical protein